MIGRAEDILVALDIGTTNIRTAVGELSKGNLSLRGAYAFPSAGMKKGIPVDMEELSAAIKNALKETSSASGVEINSVYASVSGAHVRGEISLGVSGVGGREVDRDDVERAFASARDIYVPLDREILHVVPMGYVLDGQNGIENPLGMVGERLEAKVFVITSAATPIRNLVKCCEKAGVEVAGVVFSPLAVSSAVLTDDEKQLGTALIDIGGGTTDIIAYKEGRPLSAGVIAVGGNHFTNDLAIGLKITVSEAERIKRECELTMTHGYDGSERAENLFGKQTRAAGKRQALDILRARADELFELVRRELKLESTHRGMLSNAVVTGGGSLLGGLCDVAETVLGLPVRVGKPAGIQGGQAYPEHVGYETVIGLMLYGRDTRHHEESARAIRTGILDRAKDWARDLFKIKRGGAAYVRN